MGIHTNERDANTIHTAQRWAVKVGRERQEFTDEPTARGWAEQEAQRVRRGALLYAVATLACSNEHGALQATYQPGKGWTEADI